MAEKTNFYAGCDVGSTTGKAVILKDNQIAASAIIDSELDPEQTATRVLEQACSQIEEINGIRDISYLIGTGYGRNEVPFAHENISEISCHCCGVYFLNPEIKTVMDVGGQDLKAISISDSGSVQEFIMNDKCAAGTGRFLEMMCRIFRMDLEEFSELSMQNKRIVPITAQCSVFAETEVISLLSKKKPPADIAAGIQASVAKRCFTLLKRVGIRPKVTVTGGCSKNKGMIKQLSKLLRTEPETLPVDPQLMGALGAAVTAQKKGQSSENTRFALAN
ncbi:MAG: acyl-CoA dehydratase activase [Thermodesulfobacteriota bacterium]